jgi:hypothetical protein
LKLGRDEFHQPGAGPFRANMLRAQDAHAQWADPGPDVTRFIRFFPRAPLQQGELMVQMKAPASLWRGLFIA